MSLESDSKNDFRNPRVSSLTFFGRHDFQARHAIEHFIHRANHSAIMTVALESSIADANAFRAESVL